MVSLIGTVNSPNFLWANSPLFQDVGFAFYNYTEFIAMFSWVWIRWNKELKRKTKNPRLLWPFADVTKVYEQFVSLYHNRDINSQTALLRSFLVKYINIYLNCTLYWNSSSSKKDHLRIYKHASFQWNI